MASQGVDLGVPVVDKSRYFLNDVPVAVVRFVGSDGIDYFKSIPQTNFPMLGLGVRKDGRGDKCELYENGKEVQKGIAWFVPADCLFTTTVSPGNPCRLSLPESTSTFSAVSTRSEAVRIQVDHQRSSVEISVDRPTAVSFVAFEGQYMDWRPIPRSRYSASSASSE